MTTSTETLQPSPMYNFIPGISINIEFSLDESDPRTLYFRVNFYDEKLQVLDTVNSQVSSAMINSLCMINLNFAILDKKSVISNTNHITGNIYDINPDPETNLIREMFIRDLEKCAFLAAV